MGPSTASAPPVNEVALQPAEHVIQKPTRQGDRFDRAVGPALLIIIGLGSLVFAALTGEQLGTRTGVLLWVLGVTSTSDLRYRRIANKVTYPALALAILLAALAPTLSENDMFLANVGLSEALAGAGCLFVVMLVVYSCAGGGAGDVKLATVIGAFVGPELGFWSLVLAYIAAGLASLAWACYRFGPGVMAVLLARKLGSCLLPRWIAGPSQQQQVILAQGIPLAPFYSLGTLAALLVVGR